MADQKVTQQTGQPLPNKEKSRAARLIPWIFGGLVAAGLIWVFTSIAGSSDSSADLVVDTLQAPNLGANDSVVREPAVPVAQHVASFMEFASQSRAAGAPHLYIGDGIQRLATTLESIATRYGSNDAELGPQLERLNTYARNIRRGPSSLAQTDTVRQALELGTDIMSNLQHRNFPNAAPPITAMRSTMGRLIANVPLANQMTTVEQYFRQASEALGIMVEPSAGP